MAQDVPRGDTPNTGRMEQRLSYVGLGVQDLARARQFYEEGLGWRRDDGNDDICFYQVGGTIFCLYDWAKLADDAGVSPQGAGFRGIALGYCVRSQHEV